MRPRNSYSNNGNDAVPVPVRESDIILGHVQFMVLAVLIRLDTPVIGADIARMLEGQEFPCERTQVYQALRKFRDRGLIQVTNEKS
jgi:Fe2+ or Zn2+ uptake regulation protein